MKIKVVISRKEYFLQLLYTLKKYYKPLLYVVLVGTTIHSLMTFIGVFVHSTKENILPDALLPIFIVGTYLFVYSFLTYLFYISVVLTISVSLAITIKYLLSICSKKIPLEINYEFTKSKIRWKWSLATTEILWSSIKSVEKIKGYYFFRLINNDVFLIPEKLLIKNGVLDKFTTLLKENNIASNPSG